MFCYNTVTMSSVEEYAYTFRMIVPDKTPESLKKIRDDLVEKYSESSTPLVVSTIEDYMTISLTEDTEFPDERLSYAVMLAKTALREHGIEQPVFIKAFATLMDGMELLEIHKQIIFETENDYIVNMTDELMQIELG